MLFDFANFCSETHLREFATKHIPPGFMYVETTPCKSSNDFYDVNCVNMKSQ